MTGPLQWSETPDEELFNVAASENSGAAMLGPSSTMCAAADSAPNASQLQQVTTRTPVEDVDDDDLGAMFAAALTPHPPEQAHQHQPSRAALCSVQSQLAVACCEDDLDDIDALMASALAPHPALVTAAREQAGTSNDANTASVTHAHDADRADGDAALFAAARPRVGRFHAAERQSDGTHVHDGDVRLASAQPSSASFLQAGIAVDNEDDEALFAEAGRPYHAAGGFAEGPDSDVNHTHDGGYDDDDAPSATAPPLLPLPPPQRPVVLGTASTAAAATTGEVDDDDDEAEFAAHAAQFAPAPPALQPHHHWSETPDEDVFLPPEMPAAPPLNAATAAVAPMPRHQPAPQTDNFGDDDGGGDDDDYDAAYQDYLAANADVEQARARSPPPGPPEDDANMEDASASDLEQFLEAGQSRAADARQGHGAAASLPATAPAEPAARPADTLPDEDQQALKRQRLGTLPELIPALAARQAKLVEAAEKRRVDEERATLLARMFHAPPSSSAAGPETQREEAEAAAAAAAQRREARHRSAEGDDSDMDAEPAPSFPPSPQAYDAAAAPSHRRLKSAHPRKLASDVEGTYISVTSASGDRVYCPVLRRPGLVHSGAAGGAAGGGAARRAAFGGKGLLALPMGEMLRAIELARLEDAMAESERLEALHRRHARAEEELLRQLDDPTLATPQEQQQQQHAEVDQLWVDKWAPRAFGHLLSDEATNREIAKWVKSWDRTVFGQAGGAAAVAAGKDKLAASLFKTGREQDVRPEHKLVLICGAPGLGKTTLAHVVARHCGYQPVEINASDDRTAANLSSKIKDAVQMQSVLDQKRRPNCVIIDEIDGATGGSEGHSAVQALIKIAQASAKAAAAAGEGGAATGGGGGRRKRQSNRPLHRPIICICNDLYAPALRPLREVARIFHFRVPSSDKLVDRLLAICDAESVRADKRALQLLAERCDCDIRACLNTLQFLCKRTRHIRAADIEGLGIGAKDMTKNAFSMWGELLSAYSPRRKTHRQFKNAALRQRALMAALQNFGDYDLMLSGLHENILHQSYLDISLDKTSRLCDSFAAADTFLRYVQRHQDYSLMAYVAPCLLQVQQVVTQSDKPPLNWPKAGGEAARRTAANVETLHTWAGRVAPRVLQACSGRALAMDVLPALKRVLCPSVRALAPHLLNAAEQATLSATVGVMLDYGVTFSFQDDGAAPQAGHKPWQAPPTALPPRLAPLSPPVDALHSFAGLSVPKGVAAPKAVPLVVRQMVAQQVNLEAIRRAEALRLEMDRTALLQREDSTPPLTPGAQHQGGGGGGMGGTPLPAAPPAERSRSLASYGIKPAAPAATPPAKAPLGGLAALANRPPMAAAAAAAAAAAVKPGSTRPPNWLDTLRVASSKRRAAGLMAPAGKRDDVVGVSGPSSTDAATGATASDGIATAGREVGTPSAKAGSAAMSGAAGGAGGAAPDEGGKVAGQFAVLYKYNEGYTNAVKRPLKMYELL